QILDTLGTGTFGKVALCYDNRQCDDKIALKIIRNVQKYREAAELEIRVLKKICKWDPKAEIPCVRMLDWFDYYGHTCISFNVLGSSSFDFMKDNKYSPYPMHHIQNMGYQLLCAIAFLHDNNLTHTDLKPENILFTNSSYHSEYNEELEKKQRVLRSSNICVIDFGSAVFKSEYHSRIVSTRHYRAPEVILELGWSYPCDIWSVGCILYEYYTGNALFQTHDNREHLAMMEIILGDIPIEMQLKGKKSHYFNKKGKVVWDSTGEGAKYVYRECKPLDEYARSDDIATKKLFNLLSKMLCYDPNMRTTAPEALQDSFFKLKLDNVNKTNSRTRSRTDSL
ncbi:uncharacterized protein TRIADDRAFT_18415, partial [Trichoplax adhaerens]